MDQSQFSFARLSLFGSFLLLWVLLVGIFSAEAESAPPLWKIEKAKGDVWLFGTIHLLPAASPWETRKVQEALQSTDYLVLEAPVDTVDPMAMVPLIQKYGFYPAGQTLWGSISPELGNQLKAVSLALGVPEIAFQQMKPWMAYVTITEQASSRAGFSSENGADKSLGNSARGLGKSVLYFETIEEQLQMFASIPADEQKKMLTLTVNQFEDLGTSIDGLYQAWLKGEDEALDTLIRAGFTETPEFFQRLFVQRNNTWVKRMQPMLSDENSYFIAVGAGHLVGQGSVVDLLETQGHTVKRQ